LKFSSEILGAIEMASASGKDFEIATFGDQGQTSRRDEFIEHMRRCPIPNAELLMNMGLFLTPQTLGRVLFMDFLYRQQLEVQGVVMELGTRWGQNASLFSALRGIHEPFNRLRKVVAFDTFDGFVDTDAKDGPAMKPGAYSVSQGYAAYLEKVLEFQEAESPLPHLRKHEIVKGDVRVTLPSYLERNPETVVSLVYFDLDLYEPTKVCLELLKHRVTRGTVIGFDEANDHATPGETLAIIDTWGLGKYPLKRFPASARTSYLVVE
jgi:hypothetical protein